MAQRQNLFRFIMLSVPLGLSGCGVLDWVNEHGPVIGQRCENWQCFTESGREASQEKLARMHPADNPAPSATGGMPAPGGSSYAGPNPATATPASSAKPPAQPLEPPAGPEGAYIYVPRQPAPDPTTMPLE